MEKFALGALLGGIGGALLVANNYKMRTLVRKTQDEVQAKFDQMMDEKIRAMDVMKDEIENPTPETAEKPKRNIKAKAEK